MMIDSKRDRNTLARIIARNGFVTVVEELKYHALSKLGKDFDGAWDFWSETLTKALGDNNRRNERLRKLQDKE